MRIASLAGNVALFVGAVLVVDGLIFAFVGGAAAGNPSGPPGWFVGLVWTALFASFGVARWMLRGNGDGGSRCRAWLAGFAVLCLVYPLYTIGLNNRTIGLVGDVVTAVAALLLVRRLWPVSRGAALLVSPVLPWLGFAGWTIARAMLA